MKMRERTYVFEHKELFDCPDGEVKSLTYRHGHKWEPASLNEPEQIFEEWEKFFVDGVEVERKDFPVSDKQVEGFKYVAKMVDGNFDL